MLAYFDCFSGISGDMTLGALIDLGVPVKWLKEALEGVPLKGFDLSTAAVSRGGIRANILRIQVEDDSKSRNFAEIVSLIEKSPLSGRVKEMSLEIFEKIAVAEARIHDCPKKDVHFHELGGVDALVDIVGTALCIEYLGIRKVIASRLPLGTGLFSSQHGPLPVPAPATLEILKGVPVYGTRVSAELVTPTGAAIIVALAESFATMPDMIVDKIGYGAGMRDLDSRPNLLRIIMGKFPDHNTGCQKDRVVMVETCIDNMNPEFFGFLMDRLFEEGALDVYWVPVFMKKNRPGTMVQVLCPRNRRERVINRILTETTSLGVRYYDVERAKLFREYIKVKTSYGMLQVKCIKDLDENVRIVPEYEVCRKIALEKNIPIRVVYDTIAKEAILNSLTNNGPGYRDWP